MALHIREHLAVAEQIRRWLRRGGTEGACLSLPGLTGGGRGEGVLGVGAEVTKIQHRTLSSCTSDSGSSEGRDAMNAEAEWCCSL